MLLLFNFCYCTLERGSSYADCWGKFLGVAKWSKKPSSNCVHVKLCLTLLAEQTTRVWACAFEARVSGGAEKIWLFTTGQHCRGTVLFECIPTTVSSFPFFHLAVSFLDCYSLYLAWFFFFSVSPCVIHQVHRPISTLAPKTLCSHSYVQSFFLWLFRKILAFNLPTWMFSSCILSSFLYSSITENMGWWDFRPTFQWTSVMAVIQCCSAWSQRMDRFQLTNGGFGCRLRNWGSLDHRQSFCSSRQFLSA